MSDPNYNGLCGIPLPHPQTGGTYIRCGLPLGHHGEHDWKKHEHHFYVSSYCGSRDDMHSFKNVILMSKEEYDRLG